MRVRSSLVLVPAVLLLAGCPSSDDGGSGDGGAGDSGSAVDGGSLDAGASDGGGSMDGGRPGPFTACAEGALTECFSNLDCAAEAVCLDVGGGQLAVPCCVTGPRGALPAGADCDPVTGELECASSLCLDDGAGTARCTGACTADGDCPAGMQRCATIAFSGSDARFCLFE